MNENKRESLLSQDPQSQTDDWADLDQELSRMANETPEPPSDFHARWTAAVAAEAESLRRQGTGQWRRLISVAAMMIFLIGGTLLTRTGRMPEVSLKSEGSAVTAVKQAVQREPEKENDSAAAVTPVPTALMTGAAMSEEEAPAFEADEAADMDTAGAWTLNAAFPADDRGAGREDGSAEEAPGETAEESRAAGPEAQTEQLTGNTAETDEDAAAAAAETTSEEAAGPRESTGFLADMGAFLRRGWPGLAVILALSGVWELAGTRKKRRR